MWRRWIFTRESLRSSLFEFALERFCDRHRDETGHITAEPRDFFHDPRTKIRVFLLWHQENRLNRRFEFPVHQRHLEFEFEIGDRAEATDHRRGFTGPGKVHEQSIQWRD